MPATAVKKCPPKADAYDGIEELDDDMTGDDVVDILARLKFAKGELRFVSIDRGVRDFLVRKLRQR